MALANKVVVILAILVVIKVGISEASSLPMIHKLGDSASERCTTAPGNYRTQDFSLGNTLLSELGNKDDNSVLDVSQANFQSQLCKQLDIKVDSTSAPKEQIPSLMLETSAGQNSGFPAEILVIIFFLILYFLGVHVLNLAIPAIIFFAMMYFLGIN